MTHTGILCFRKDGKGTANFFDVEKKIDLYVSSLSKGLGSFGGYVCGKKKLIDLCINTSKTFIYTSALPSSINQYSLNRFNSKREIYREKLWGKINLFHKRLEEIETSYHIYKSNNTDNYWK